MATAAPSEKLRGRLFYESIGSPKVVLAPMVDHSEFAWRMLSRTFMPHGSAADGTGKSVLLAYTPMLHAKLFGEQEKYRKESFESHRGQMSSTPKAQRLAEVDEDSQSNVPFLDGHPALDRPLFTQFCANDPDALLKAAEFVAPYCDAVDLNLGCPQGIAKRGNYGAFLQEQRPLVFRLINKLHTELHVPVTAKIRIQSTREDTLAYAKMVLDAGANVLAVHGRQRHQKGQQTGLADWDAIRHLRDSLPPETVIFANGNILQHDDIAACLDATGADAVMSAEANLYDPSIFAPPPPPGSEGREYWRDADGTGGWRVDAVLRRYLDIIYTYVLECSPPQRPPLYVPKAGEQVLDLVATSAPIAKAPVELRRSPNLSFMRGHLYKMLRPLITKYTDIRELINKTSVGDMAAFEHTLHRIETVVAQSLAAYESGDLTVAEHVKQPQTDVEKRIWRPWWVCQTYVRALPEAATQPTQLMADEKPVKGFDPLDMGLGLTLEEISAAG